MHTKNRGTTGDRLCVEGHTCKHSSSKGVRCSSGTWNSASAALRALLCR